MKFPLLHLNYKVLFLAASLYAFPMEIYGVHKKILSFPKKFPPISFQDQNLMIWPYHLHYPIHRTPEGLNNKDQLRMPDIHP